MDNERCKSKIYFYKNLIPRSLKFTTRSKKNMNTMFGSQAINQVLSSLKANLLKAFHNIYKIDT